MIIADQTNIIVTTITLNHQYAAPSLGSKEILISFAIGSLALEYWSFHVVDVGKIYLNCRWLHVPYLDLLGLIVKKTMQEHSKVKHAKKYFLFSHSEMMWQTNLRVHVLLIFGNQGGFILSKDKNSTPDRMKQSLERRMLRDSCKTFISDHVLQEFPQDANDDL